MSKLWASIVVKTEDASAGMTSIALGDEEFRRKYAKPLCHFSFYTTSYLVKTLYFSPFFLFVSFSYPSCAFYSIFLLLLYSGELEDIILGRNFIKQIEYFFKQNSF